MWPDRQPKLVQVMYDERFGLLAFFEDGQVAMRVTRNGRPEWQFREHIWKQAVHHEWAGADIRHGKAT
jgi:hypothetical protein